jgi:anti-anti-sigma regulatory factor
MSTCSERTSLILTGEMTVSAISSFHAKVSEALESEGDLAVDLSAVTEIDLSGVQLLWAARRAAANMRRGFSACTPVPPAVQASFDLAGLDPFRSES